MSSNTEDAIQHSGPARSSGSTGAEVSRADTDAASISSSTSYCSNCPFCNPPNPSLASQRSSKPTYVPRSIIKGLRQILLLWLRHVQLLSIGAGEPTFIDCGKLTFIGCGNPTFIDCGNPTFIISGKPVFVDAIPILSVLLTVFAVFFRDKLFARSRSSIPIRSFDGGEHAEARQGI
ncbi:hypothetical protein ACHAQJ_003144 [Trichoderma viride]